MKYIYYRIWKLLSRIPTNDQPATNSVILLTIFENFNVATVYFMLQYYYKDYMVNLSFDKKIIAIVPTSIIMLLNYLFLYKRRNNLYEKYKNESKTQNRFGYVLLFIYIIATFALLLYFIQFRSDMDTTVR